MKLYGYIRQKNYRRVTCLIMIVIVIGLLVGSLVGFLTLYRWFQQADCVSVKVIGLNSDAKTVILIADSEKNGCVTLQWCRKKVFPFYVHPQQYHDNVINVDSKYFVREHVQWVPAKRYGIMIYNNHGESSLYWVASDRILFHSHGNWVSGGSSVLIDIQNAERGDLQK